MKKLTVLIIALLSLSFAVDYVGVNSGSKRGKFSKTSSPVFAEVTATTANYTYTGTVTANLIVSTTDARITGEVYAATVNASADIVAPKAYLTTVLSTLVNTSGVLSEKPLIFGSLCPTSAATNVTANFSIPVTVNGTLYNILLRK